MKIVPHYEKPSLRPHTLSRVECCLRPTDLLHAVGLTRSPCDLWLLPMRRVGYTPRGIGSVSLTLHTYYTTKREGSQQSNCTNFRKFFGKFLCKLTTARANPPASDGEDPSCGEFGYTIRVVLAVCEHPTIGRKHFAVCLRPLAVIGGALGNPTLQVVAVVGGENFARGQAVCGVSHSEYLHSFSTPILYHKLSVLSSTQM